MSKASAATIGDPDAAPDPAAELAAAMAAINPVERAIFARVVRRRIRTRKYQWVLVVNRIGIGTATRAVMAARWSTTTAVTGVVTILFFRQHTTTDTVLGIVSAAVCAFAFVSYLTRMGELLKAIAARRRG